MSFGEYVVGAGLLAVLIAGFGFSAMAIRCRLVPSWTGAPAILATIVLALSIAIVTCEALGVLGLLNTPALLIAAAIPSILLARRRGTDAGGTVPPAPPVGRLALVVAAGASLLTAVHWAGPVLESLDVGIYRQDSLWYHLPTAAWIAQTGSVGGLLFTDPLKLAVWYYPDNSELLHAIGMVVLGNDLLSPLLNFGWMAVALLAGWCIGRPFGLAPVTLLGTVLVVDSDMMLIQAGNAPSDIAALACLLAAIAILANGSTGAGGINPPGRSTIGPGPLGLAALAAGLAIGAKVTMLVPVGVISLGLLAYGRSELGRRAPIWIGGLLTTGGFWYLRNLVHSGNPLPWISPGPIPGPDQDDLYPRAPHSVAHYLADRHAWTDFFFPGLGETLGPLWFLILFAAAAGVILALRSRRRPLIVLGLASVAAFLAYVLIPISASGANGAPSGFASNLRYASPAIAIGLVLLPLCETRAMARRVILPVYAAIALIAAIGSDEWVQPAVLGAIAIAIAAVGLPLWLVGRPNPRRRAALAVPIVVLAGLIAGFPEQQSYFENRYEPAVAPTLDNPGFRATEQWQAIQAWAIRQRNLRIGIVGAPAAYGQYVLYGEDLSNRVRYLGEPRPHGGLGPIAGCEAWNQALLDSHVDVVVITPEDPGTALLPPQIAWTRLGRGSVPVLQEPPAGVYRIARHPDPGACIHYGGGSGRFGQLGTPPGAAGELLGPGASGR